MTYHFRPHDFEEMGIAPPRGWNPGRQPHQRPQTAAERQAKHRQVQWSIVNSTVHRCKKFHAERTRLSVAMAGVGRGASHKRRGAVLTHAWRGHPTGGTLRRTRLLPGTNIGE